MDKFKYVKTVVGKLIGFYRKEYGLPADDFLIGKGNHYQELCKNCKKCDKPELICSRATLYRLEKGNIVNNECIYHRIAEKLNKSVILDNHSIYNKLLKYRELLVESLVDYSRTQLEKINAEISFDMIKYKNVLYINEILNLYNDIIQCILYKNSVANKNSKIYESLLNIVAEEDKKLIIFLFYNDNFRCLKVTFTIESINEICSNYFDDPLFFEAKLYSLTEDDSLSSYNYLLSLRDSKSNELTAYHKYLLNKEIGYIQLEWESYHNCYDTFLKCLELLKQFDSDITLKKSSYQDLGKICHLLKRYNEASNWFMKARNLVDSKSIGPDYVFLFHALEKQNKYKLILEIIDSIDMTKMKNEYGKRIVIYYKMKHTLNLDNMKNIINLENYVCNLKNYINQYGKIHKDIFETELKIYISISGNYKKYYLFNS